MIALRRGLFIILGAATAATTLEVWAQTASAAGTQAGSAQASSAPPPIQYFPPAAIWTQDVSTAPVDPQSATIIDSLSQAGGWGTGTMRVDSSIRVMQANASTPTVRFSPVPGFDSAGSDLVPSVPLPPGGGMEAQSGYQCPVEEQDCHFIVVNTDQGKLYEAIGANYDGSALSAGFLAIWDLNRVYPASGRGDQCSSADAAGFPIAPLLFTADELARGRINHAIRFILPNDRIRAGVFVQPATHAGSPQGPASDPPYGVHLRLKASYDLSQLKPAARVVAAAMQKYGMFLADGGSIALTAQSDQDTQTKYSDVDFNPSDLSSLKVTDFEVVQLGPVIPLTYDCVRNP
jgi:serine/threonine-protein kinase